MTQQHDAVNERLTLLATRYLGRPTMYFADQHGIPDGMWGGPGFYLLLLEEDGAELLGPTFDEAWRQVNLRIAEIKQQVEARERQTRAAARRAAMDRFLDGAEGTARRIGGIWSQLDGVLDEGVRRLKSFSETVELGRELMRPGDDDGDGGRSA